MLLEGKPSLVSIDTTQIATCVANMLHKYLIAEQQLIKMEDINNDNTQSSKSSCIKTSIYLIKTINNETGKARSGKYEAE